MLEINLNYLEIILTFNGMKIINCTFPSLLAKKLLNDNTQITIDKQIIKKHNIIYLNDFNKLSDFLNLNKGSILMKKIIDFIGSQNLINDELIRNLIQKINAWIGTDYLSINEGDQLKLINLLFEIIKDFDLNQELFSFLLNNDCWPEKQLFIFDNVSWIKKEQLYSQLNNHAFLLLTSDFRNYFNYHQDLELITIFDDNYESIDLLDFDKVINYLELKMNQPITLDEINHHLKNKQTRFSHDFYYHLVSLQKEKL